jgi:site-specific recombinase XerD
MNTQEKKGQGNSLAEQAIGDYLLWMIDQGYSRRAWSLYERLLRYFAAFIARRALCWEHIFTVKTLEAFQQECRLCHAGTAVRGLARYLYRQGKIPQPLTSQPGELPDIYEDYLRYYAKTRQAGQTKTPGVRRLLTALHVFLTREKVALAAVRIEHLDTVLAEHTAGLRPGTRQARRSWLRDFLRYLYQVRGLLQKDLARLVVGAPQYAQAKPPKFLRPQEIRQLFNTCQPRTPRELRTHAMLHLAYSLGLRPKEISLIRLDDISFLTAEISLPDRKCQNPVKFPVPETAIKAVAAYIIGGRPKTASRALFLKLQAPYHPVLPVTVSQDIQVLMRTAGLSASAYWLRHTYAQNLLETQASIFEIKEMLGHDRIETTRRYLHIHTRLMREVLFNETL